MQLTQLLVRIFYFFAVKHLFSQFCDFIFVNWFSEQSRNCSGIFVFQQTSRLHSGDVKQRKVAML